MQQVDAAQCFSGKGQIQDDDAGPVLQERLIATRHVARSDDVLDVAQHEAAGFCNDWMVVDDEYRTQMELSGLHHA